MKSAGGARFQDGRGRVVCVIEELFPGSGLGVVSKTRAAREVTRMVSGAGTTQLITTSCSMGRNAREATDPACYRNADPASSEDNELATIYGIVIFEGSEVHAHA
jgi:hypothetical protein